MADNFNVFDSSSLVDLGNDFTLSDNKDGGDITVSSFGDLVAVNQLDNLRKAIKRRLFTPKGALGVYIQDVTGLYYIDGEYGNEAYKFLSEPLTSELLSNMKDAIIECLTQEPRISVIDVIPTIQSSPEGIVTVDFLAEYSLVETNTEDNLVITFDPSTGTLT